MVESERCESCGSWGEACANTTPVKDCGCARCLSARLDVVKKDAMLLRAQVAMLRRTVSDYYNACTCTGSDIEHVNRWARSVMDLVKE